MFVSVSPQLESKLRLFMLENFCVNAFIGSKEEDLNGLQVQLWTNVVHKENPDAKWHAVEMHLVDSNANEAGHSLYSATVRTTCYGHFEFTVRFRRNLNSPWTWAGPFGHNGKVHVLAPHPQFYPWSQGPIALKIVENLFIGNFIAASGAFDMGFTAVLNMAEELNSEDNRLKCKKFPCKDGAVNEIPEKHIKDAVEWILEHLARKEKILVHCRAGIGRSGSVIVAYLFATNPDWNYEKALDSAWVCKPDIYPHKSLQETLERLWPRTNQQQQTQQTQQTQQQ